MVNVIFVIYALLLALLTAFYYRREGDFYHIKTFTSLLFLLEVPYALSLYNGGVDDYRVLRVIDSQYDYYFLFHIFLKALVYVTTIIVVTLFEPRSSGMTLRFGAFNFVNQASFGQLCFYFGVAVGSYVYFLLKIGGVESLILSVSDKSAVVAGTGLVRNIMLVAGALSLVVYYRLVAKGRLTFSVVGILALVVPLVIMLGSFGERKNPILILILALVLHRVFIKKSSLISMRNVVFFMALVFFASLAPVIRQDGYLTNDFSFGKLMVDSFPYMGELFKRFSDIDIALFVYPTFEDASDRWYLATVMDFFSGFVPRSIYPEKPPLDEGIYIYNLANNNSQDIGAPFYNFIPVGWPLGKATSGYVHFGIFGVVIYTIFSAIFLKYVYSRLVNSGYAPVVTFIYIWLMSTNFVISNAFIFNLIMILVITGFLSMTFRFLSVFRIR